MLLDTHQARRLLVWARQEKFALLAVNADSPAAVADCLLAAREADAPIMVETSLWQLVGHSFGMGDAALGMVRYLADLVVLANSKAFSCVPVLFHTDHIKGPVALPLLEQAIRGFSISRDGGRLLLRPSSVSLDSSAMSPSENIESARRLLSAAEAVGLTLTFEMEAGVDDGLTPVAEAEALLRSVERANPGHLALWAPGVGTQHGFSDAGYPAFSPEHVAAHAAMAEQVTDRPIGIALHGSSGLPAEHLCAAVAAGVTKVNWSSESLLLRSAAAREFYLSKTAELDSRHPQFKPHAMDNGIQQFVSARYVPKVIERIRLLGGSGRGQRMLASLGDGSSD